MALALSKEQLTKLNKKDILQLLLESMEQEKELRSQLAVLTDELKRTNISLYTKKRYRMFRYGIPSFDGSVVIFRSWTSVFECWRGCWGR